MHKHILPGTDAAILALIAQSAHLPSDDKIEKIIGDLSCECTKQIGRDILSNNTDNPVAKAFLDWADSLRGRNA